jgi:ribosomal protein S18 acetylase RimI-like enzyme
MDFYPEKVQLTYDPSEINPAEVHDYLSRSYWAPVRTLEQVKTSISTAGLVTGLKYDGKLLGFARLLSDGFNFGMLCDVFILEEYRGYGLGKYIVKSTLNHPAAKSLKKITLNTRDAQKLYEKFGFLYEGKKLSPSRIPTYSMTYIKVSDDYYLKYFTRDDYDDMISLIEKHWEPSFTSLIHPMFYRDFYKTCFTARSFDGELLGFVLSFVSQDNPGEGYIHTAFVHPKWRKNNIGRTLYNQVFSTFSNRGMESVRLIISPDSNLSINYHKKMGFDFAPECTGSVDGIPAAIDYEGKGAHRVVMEKLFT